MIFHILLLFFSLESVHTLREYFFSDSPEGGNCVGLTETKDYGFIAACHSSSFGTPAYSFLAIKMNYDGKTEWMTTIGGSGGYTYASQFVEIPGGGYMGFGNTDFLNSVGSTSVMVFKLSSAGNVEWLKTIDANETHSDGADSDSCVSTLDGGYAYAGNSGGGLTFAKLDSSGDVVFYKRFPGEGNNYGRGLKELSDGSFILVGYGESFSQSPGVKNGVLMKFDSNGNLLWAKSFGGNQNDIVSSVSLTDDGGFWVVGNTFSSGEGQEDQFIIRFNSTGGLIFANTLGSTAQDRGVGSFPTNDGGLYVSGETNMDGGYLNTIVVKYNGTGGVVWVAKSGDTSRSDRLHALSKSSLDDGALVTGYVGADSMPIMKVSKNGMNCNTTFETNLVLNPWNVQVMDYTPPVVENLSVQSVPNTTFIETHPDVAVYSYIPGCPGKTLPCSPNYFGDGCNVTTCKDGKLNNMTSTVCSGKGTCHFYDMACDCMDNYFGPPNACSFTKCYGILSNDSMDVCGGNGNCTDFNLCHCTKEGYYGDSCNTTMCNGVFSNQTDVCNGNGKCSSFEHCSCNGGYENPAGNMKVCSMIVANGASNSVLVTCIVFVLFFLLLG